MKLDTIIIVILLAASLAGLVLTIAKAIGAL